LALIYKAKHVYILMISSQNNWLSLGKVTQITASIPCVCYMDV